MIDSKMDEKTFNNIDNQIEKDLEFNKNFSNDKYFLELRKDLDEEGVKLREDIMKYKNRINEQTNFFLTLVLVILTFVLSIDPIINLSNFYYIQLGIKPMYSYLFMTILLFFVIIILISCFISKNKKIKNDYEEVYQMRNEDSRYAWIKLQKYIKKKQSK